MSTSQALLFALLGAAMASAVFLAWVISERQQRRVAISAEPAVSPEIASVLAVLRSSAIVVGDDDGVLKASAPAYALGLVLQGALTDRDLAELVQQVRRDGQIRDTELAIIRSPGTPPRYLTARVAPLGSGRVLALVDDRTRERRVEATRRDFVANVSHELKTPVGAIRLLAEAVQDASGDAEAVERFAGRMSHEAERLTRLVQQIIELSRLQGDDPLEEPMPVSVDDVVATAIDNSAIDAGDRHISVRTSGEAGLKVLGNREQVSVAVSNLVSNAVSYSSEGSTVTVGVKLANDLIEISVTDQGIGIPAVEIDRIFERFYRVDPARHRSTGGTGLGLSIVKHVAATHGGDVRVWSVEGQGSTFTLILPNTQLGTQSSNQQKETP